MFNLPKLPYSYDGLEPYIDAETLETHYSRHHKGYTDNFNLAIKGTEWEQKSAEYILSNLDKIPEDIRQSVINNGGGYLNHCIYRETLCPNGKKISSTFENIISSQFTSFEEFKYLFSKKAATHFGSGRTWLVKDKTDKLSIISTSNQDSPLSLGLYPLLGIDLWEHSYYLKYKNLRLIYIKNWWEIVNREVVEKKYEA